MLVMSDITGTIKINDLKQSALLSKALPTSVSYKMRSTINNITDCVDKLFQDFSNLPTQTVLMLNPI
jgi:hypothetical protein